MTARRKDSAGRADPRRRCRSKNRGSPETARIHRPARAPRLAGVFVQAISSAARWLFYAGGAWLRRVAAVLRRRFARRPAPAAVNTKTRSSSPRSGRLRVDVDLSSPPLAGDRRGEIYGSSLPTVHAPPSGQHGAPPVGCASHAAPTEGPASTRTGRPSIDAARAQPAPRHTAELVVVTTAPHGEARGGEGTSELDGLLYGFAGSCLGSNLDAPHSSDAAPPTGILSIDIERADGGEGVQQLVFEEPPPAARSVNASVHPAATSSSLPAEGRIPDDAFVTSVGANRLSGHAFLRASSSLSRGTPADFPTAADRARREPPAGGGNRDGADAVAPAWANAYTDAPTANHPGLVEGLPPGLEGGGRRAMPVAVEEHLVERAPHAEPRALLHSNATPTADRAHSVATQPAPKKEAFPRRAARGAKEPASANNNGDGYQLIEKDPECEAHHKYVKKNLAWRKGFTLCLICHLEGREIEIKANNVVIIKHCSAIHQANGYKCQKRGCLARGKTKHDTGLHEIECLGIRKRKC